ncbi:MAG: hypothetical protein ACRDIY_01070 [Chloroflexota bacterium]
MTDGISAGLIAGATMLAAEMVASTVLGASALGPVRLFASIVLGPAALSRIYPLSTAVAVGVGVHLILSALFGVVALQGLGRMGWLDAEPARLLAGGAAYGALLWAIDFLIVGWLVFPRFSVVSPVWNGVVPHVVFYGLVLGGYLALTRPRSG